MYVVSSLQHQLSRLSQSPLWYRQIPYVMREDRWGEKTIREFSSYARQPEVSIFLV